MTPRGPSGGEPPGDPEFDARWQDIVARLGDLSVPVDGPSKDVASDPAPGEPGQSDDTTPPDPSRTSDPSLSDPRAWAPDPAFDEAEDHFEPPEPEPVLGGDPLLTLAWIVVLAVPVLTIISLVAAPQVPTFVLQGAGLAFLAALGLLLWRMPHDRDDDDPGAVV